MLCPYLTVYVAMPLRCPFVQVSNGDVVEEVNTDNDQVQVLTCDPGYQPVGGVTTRTCNHTTGTWNKMKFINNGTENTFGCEGRVSMVAMYEYETCLYVALCYVCHSLYVLACRFEHAIATFVAVCTTKSTLGTTD